MMRTITRIIVHCSASIAGVDLYAEDIRAYHCNPVKQGGRGWHHPGYHYVVRLDGTVEPLLDESLVANGVKGFNQTAIHVCYIGGLDKKGRPANTMTEAQYASMRRLLTDLLKKYPAATLHGHNEFAAKACPCFKVNEVFKKLISLCE